MADIIVNYHFLDVGQTFSYYNDRRSSFQNIYADLLSSEPLVGGRVLDIGCGHGVNPTLSKIIDKINELDGIDPFPVMEPPHHLVRRWTCNLEDIPVEENTYDMAFSYNVVEHVANINSFIRTAVCIIKPGSVYWSLSPNAHHPFTWVTRVVQFLGFKQMYAKRLKNSANSYPAYYKLSSDSNILHAIRDLELPVSEIDFYYIPNVQWDGYFPRRLKWIAHMLDKIFILNKEKRSFIFMFRLKKRMQ